MGLPGGPQLENRDRRFRQGKMGVMDQSRHMRLAVVRSQCRRLRTSGGKASRANLTRRAGDGRSRNAALLAAQASYDVGDYWR